MSVLNIRSLLLGVAAAATATTAQAADLPVAPEPVDYVRICDAYGARFYYIPGTETCLRVGGRVRTQFRVNNVLDDGAWGARNSDGYTWRTQGYLYLDARTATEFGTLRAYTEISQAAENGAESLDFGSTYIQWGGLTAGYLTSNFDIFTGQVFMGVVSRNWSDTTLNQIAYTAAFGNGFSATVALEDRSSREINPSFTTDTVTSNQGRTVSVATSETYGGTRMPDVVAAIAVSQGWGSAQLSGALHQVYHSSFINSTLSNTEDDLGWAIGAGVLFNLPMINSGSNVFFQGFYADGAMSYLGGSFTQNGSTFSILDAGLDNNGNIDTTTGYSLSAGAYIQATPTIGLALDGSYLSTDGGGNTLDVDRWAIDGSIQWEPVSGFEMGADIGYSNLDVQGRSDVDELLFGVRVQRTF
ncbi:porin [uncultured Roseibium sp.]|uniref:porin n=1 Tax=uncultured Roseibium sp. TaxID=1936171 RepID=UPI00260E86E3|nr:porin [uncultured Roseibium sp.]